MVAQQTATGAAGFADARQRNGAGRSAATETVGYWSAAVANSAKEKLSSVWRELPSAGPM